MTYKIHLLSSYQKLLKTLAILEAQKMQAIRVNATTNHYFELTFKLFFFCLLVQDLEMLVQAQAKAEKDPLTFVEALKNGVST